MPTFICEKCGRLDNSANTNNYWYAMGNKYAEQKSESISPHYTDDYFNNHVCCALCCKGLQYIDGSGKNHFSGDKFDCVTDYTYKEADEQTLKSCSNIRFIQERDNI